MEANGDRIIENDSQVSGVLSEITNLDIEYKRRIRFSTFLVR